MGARGNSQADHRNLRISDLDNWLDIAPEDWEGPLEEEGTPEAVVVVEWELLVEGYLHHQLW